MALLKRYMQQSYIAAFNNLDDAAEAVLSILKQGLDITAVEFLILSEQDSQLAWQLRDNILSGIMTISQQEPLDFSVPVNEFVNYFKYTHEVEEKVA